MNLINLLPENLTIREIVKQASWYAAGKRSIILTEKQITEYELKLNRATPEHVLMVISNWIAVNKSMPEADELWEVIYYSYTQDVIQQRIILRIQEARERQQ
ncbi:MAG: hypothetical protein K2X63_01995 [Burkholderiaceae bacterium]|nr:hypothetical protein [Burkholderiaceae bacterium]